MKNNLAAANKAWLEDGALIMQYTHQSSLDEVLELIDESLKLVTVNGKPTLPVIVIQVHGDDLRLPVHQIGKVINTQLISHTSILLLVGLKNPDNKMYGLVNTLFLNNRLITCDSLDEAKKIATAKLNDATPVLEQ
ncbi:MAG: hypothetical protein QFB87_03685 [Patescibacteria group bacterium]|nr:hypothetical protein [Patescibacteria group bacterium]